AHVQSISLTDGNRITRGQVDDAVEDARQHARDALKPFGYYHPDIATNLLRAGPESWRLEMRIERGPPVRVTAAEIDVRGPGASLGQLQEWLATWPLKSGAVLDQQLWEQENAAALEAANPQ